MHEKWYTASWNKMNIMYHGREWETLLCISSARETTAKGTEVQFKEAFLIPHSVQKEYCFQSFSRNFHFFHPYIFIIYQFNENLIEQDIQMCLSSSTAQMGSVSRQNSYMICKCISWKLWLEHLYLQLKMKTKKIKYHPNLDKVRNRQMK